MATITVRQLDEKTKSQLRVRAAHHGRSMEEEAREILRSAVSAPSLGDGNLAKVIHERFVAFGGLELKVPRRDAMRRTPDFTDFRFERDRSADRSGSRSSDRSSDRSSNRLSK